MILFLIGIIGGHRVVTAREEFEPQKQTEDLQREATILGFSEPEQIVRYMLSALFEGDQDKILRGCPIDERSLGVSVAKIIEREEKFTTDLTIAPSADYSSYVPLASTELARSYIDKSENYIAKLRNMSGASLKRIDFVRPAEQMEDEYKIKVLETNADWGTELIVEMMAQLEYAGKNYMTTFTLSCYDGYWKIFAFESELAGVTGDNPVQKITEEEYLNLAGEKSLKDYEKYIDKKILIDEKTEAKADDKVAPEDELLAANYFVANQANGKTPQETIEKFTLYLQKKISQGVEFFDMSVEENEMESQIRQQEKYAKQIKRLCYSLMKSDFPENKMTCQISIKREMKL